MNGFETALGWYKISTYEDYEIVLKLKVLELVNFKTNGASCFKDENGMIYLLETHKISCMRPCDKPRTLECELNDKFGVCQFIFIWCKTNDVPFFKKELKIAIDNAQASFHGELYSTNDIKRRTLAYYRKLLNLKQYSEKCFSDSDVI